MDPLRLPVFRRLFAAYTVNEIGDSVALVALALLVYEQTGSALSTAALFLATRFLPALLAPVLIAHVDQRNLRPVLPLIYLGEGVVFLALAVLSESFLLAGVLVLGLLDGTLALAGRGLVRSAVAASLEPRGLLREGNGLMNVGFAVAAVGGAALGGLLVAEFGFAAALSADAATFFVIGLLLVTSPDLPEADLEREQLRERLAGGIAFVREHPTLRLLVGGQGLALVFFTLIVPIEVVYARETLGTTEAGFGALLSAWGGGIVVGSLIFIVTKRAPPLLLALTSTLAVAVAYIGMSLVDTLAAACAISVLGGIGNGVQWVAVMTALQAATPLALQARVVGLLESVAAAAPGVGFVIGGLLTSVTSPATAYGVAGWGLLALLAIACAVRLRRGPAAPTGSPSPPPASHLGTAEQPSDHLSGRPG